MSSNMRQRKEKTKTSSWEITSDEGESSSSVGGGGGGGGSGSSGVQMYNPLHYQAPSASRSTASPLAVSSNPTTISSSLRQQQQHSLPPSSTGSSTVSSGGGGGGGAVGQSWDQVMEAKRINTISSGGGGGGLTGKYHQKQYIGLRGDPILMAATSTPRFIADKDYQAYIQGRLGKSTRERPAVNGMCMARFCTSFSIIAMICLFMVGVIIDRQPLYIPGVLPQHIQYTTGDRKQQIFYAIPSGSSERLEPASNAYWSAMLYFFTACICYGYVNNAGWWIKRWWRQHQGRPYRDIPDVQHPNNGGGSRDGIDNDYYYDDVQSTVPTFHNGGLPPSGGSSRKGYHHNDAALPMYGDNDKKKSAAEAWRTNNPMLASAVQRINLYVSSAWADRRKQKRRFAGAKDV